MRSARGIRGERAPQLDGVAAREAADTDVLFAHDAGHLGEGLSLSLSGGLGAARRRRRTSERLARRLSARGSRRCRGSQGAQIGGAAPEQPPARPGRRSGRQVSAAHARAPAVRYTDGLGPHARVQHLAEQRRGLLPLLICLARAAPSAVPMPPRSRSAAHSSTSHGGASSQCPLFSRARR
ncbi:unnamed protein product [Prorocentrum cordatum]|uniref:Uncharacterized protein n=1 Tax=Prorocentrum cordatum TaxID=2364126 RepID=A0ABN9XX90_9DINO|nr:unnamed protein product [Polarella glacialis]